MIIHKIRLLGRVPKVTSGDLPMTWGSINTDAVRFVTDTLWDGYTPTAQFTDRFGTQVYEVLPDTEGLFPIPTEVLCGDRIGVTLVGIKGDARLVSETAWLETAANRYTEDTQAAEASSPTLCEQLTERVARLEAASAQTDSDASGLTLIDTYTFNGKSGAVFLDQEPDGTPYDFERILIAGLSSPDGGYIANTGVFNINGGALYGSGRITLGYTPSVGSVAAFALRYDTKDGLSLCAARTMRNTVYQSAQMSFNTVFTESVTSIEFQSNGITPAAGATLTIYAKRR